MDLNQGPDPGNLFLFINRTDIFECNLVQPGERSGRALLEICTLLSAILCY